MQRHLQARVSCSIYLTDLGPIYEVVEASNDRDIEDQGNQDEISSKGY